MKKVDAIVQTVMIGMCIITAVTIYIPMLILPFIGLWQLITSGVAFFYRKNTRKIDQTLLKIYWLAVFGYAVLSAISYIIFPSRDFTMILLVLLPWSFAFYCLTITWLRAINNHGDMQEKKTTETQFLDNIDF